jgi:predicted membrane-bound spermidine synthase
MYERAGGTELRARGATYAGLFMVTLATLMYEIGLTRIFSVTMWYHFAFVSVSIALFGMTVGALIVHHFPSRFPDADLHRRLWRYSLLFAVTIPPCFVAQLALPFTPHATPLGLLSIVATCVIISVPFVFSGIVVALALTRFPNRVNRLYAADLVGAAVGCIALVALLHHVDGPSAIIAIAALAAVGAVCFAAHAGRRRLVLAGATVALLGTFAGGNAAAARDGEAWLRIIWTKEVRDTDHLEDRWNAFSRVVVDGTRERPEGIVIDGTAGTALPAATREHDAFLQRQISNLVHWMRPDSDVLVVGSGGGTDVRSALAFDQRSVTGVEINPLVLHFANDVFGEYTGNLDRDPRVTFVNEEARSFVARTDAPYDIIQISLIDTWAAQGAGAFALSENSLYTTDAWELFFDRLEPGGVLSVTRFYEHPGVGQPLEMYRTVALAAQTLTNIGIDSPRDHMLVYRTRLDPSFPVQLATLLVSPEPLTDADRTAIAAAADELGFETVLTPTESTSSLFAELAAPGGPSPALDEVAADISPPTDDRPFFFQMADLDTFLRGEGFRDDFVTRPVLVLGLLAIAVVVLALCFIVLPLLISARRSATRDNRRGMAPFYAYFTAIGLGFLLIEISQLQRLSIFLGNPTYSLAVVLCSVLLFSGLGSMATERIVADRRPATYLAPLIVLVVVAALYGNVSPQVLAANEDATTPARIAIAVALLAPLSIGLGMPFVIGMRAAAARGGPTAFLWGINGAASVCASVFGVLIAVLVGISASFWSGASTYAVATAAMAVIVYRERAVATVVSPELSPDVGRMPAVTAGSSVAPDG